MVVFVEKALGKKHTNKCFHKLVCFTFVFGVNITACGWISETDQTVVTQVWHNKGLSVCTGLYIDVDLSNAFKLLGTVHEKH